MKIFCRSFRIIHCAYKVSCQRVIHDGVILLPFQSEREVSDDSKAFSVLLCVLALDAKRLEYDLARKVDDSAYAFDLLRRSLAIVQQVFSTG